MFKLHLTAAALLTVVLSAPGAFAVPFTFSVDSAVSGVDLTLVGLSGPTPITQPITETIPLSGSITLDVDVSGGTVQSVDFLSLDLLYVVDVANPVVFEANLIPQGIPFEIRLPFDPALASGNPITPLDPRLTLDAASAGLEAGTGGGLTLADPGFGFEATGQLFGSPLAPDGFPFNLGPYPLQDTFPGAPPDPNALDGAVTLVGNQLVFDATFLSIGLGGVGLVQAGQVHDGSLTATAVVPEPSTALLLGLGLATLSRARRTAPVI
ncbi:MAG: PEP-CTERM sorting domain-containing protein [Myxococcota bacterium]